ncbi:MAG: pilus assembly protein TadG-related protein [Acidimicrobiales bacterium]
MALLATNRHTDRKDESGYVLATTALLLIPLMIFAAFAVDVGAWYAEADQAQRAADAAALAAGVEVPSAALATAAAKSVAASNGYVDQPGCDDPTQPCTPAPGAYPQVITQILGPSTVRVTILTEGEAYFGQVVLNGIEIERYATVELTRPLPMGTPSNALGTGRDNVYRPGDPDNFWLNIHEQGTLRQYGDPLSIPLADNGNVNDQRDTRGFLYLMNIPAGSVGMRLQARVSCFADSSSDLILNLYQPDPTTPNYYDDNIVPANLAVQAGGSSSDVVYPLDRSTNCPNAYDPNAAEEEGPWQNVATNLTPGVWVVQAKSSNTGRLLYSLRVSGAFGNSCSTITDPDCPTLSPLNYLGVYTDQDMFPNSLRNGNGTLPGVSVPIELYLAEVGPENYRSTLEVTMFDTADGIDQVEVLMPPNAAGVRLPAPLSWVAIAESGYSEYVGTALDGSNCINGAGTCVRREPLGGGQFFQDRLIRITIDLNNVPGGYTCTTDCWVKIRYTTATSGVNLGETTAWRARIIGDPLRLIE